MGVRPHNMSAAYHIVRSRSFEVSPQAATSLVDLTERPAATSIDIFRVRPAQ
jgi:hypothetical protein